MTTQTTGQGLGLNGLGRVPTGPVGTALPTRQRHNGMVALAVALIVGLAAIGAYLYSAAGEKVPVVMVVREVPAGQAIERADLTTVNVSGQVVAFGAGRLDSLVGQRAAVPLLPNMLLQRSMVTQGETLPAGQSEVGVAVRSGQIPADGLKPGDIVQVISLPTREVVGEGGKAATLVERAQVFAARPDPSVNGGTLLTLVVPSAAGSSVATASGAGQVALIRVPK